MAALDTRSKRLASVETPFTEASRGDIKAGRGRVVMVGASANQPSCLVSLDLDGGRITRLRQSQEVTIDEGYLSAPRPLAFETTDGNTAHALYYPPRNRDFAGPPEERPPLLVMSHGGPTSATSTALSLGIQFWTSRGIAVVDVNYGGSTGYGTACRRRLNGQWGIVDVDDCVNAALHLVRAGEVDGDRLLIIGGSAGGFTTLAALTFRDVFRASASYYGVSDLEALARDTHKGVSPRGAAHRPSRRHHHAGQRAVRVARYPHRSARDAALRSPAAAAPPAIVCLSRRLLSR